MKIMPFPHIVSIKSSEIGYIPSFMLSSQKVVCAQLTGCQCGARHSGKAYDPRFLEPWAGGSKVRGQPGKFSKILFQNKK